MLFLIASLLIAFMTGLIHFGTKNAAIPTELGRKILHFSVIMVCAYVIANTDARESLAYLFFGASVLLFWITQRQLLLPNDRKSYGIALFPVAFGALLISPLSLSAVLFGVLTLGISDALAGVLGQRYGKHQILFLAERKSWVGFGVFYAATLCISIAFVGFTPIIFLLALVPALTELFSYRGSDNLLVPLVTAAWFAAVHKTEITLPLLAILLLLLAFGYFVLHKKWLTEAGAAAAALLAVVIVMLCGSLYLVPLLVFFAAGSLSSKLQTKQKEHAGRNAIQVFCNGLVPTLCLCAYAGTGAQEEYMIAYFASVCIHLTDTISSDVGTYFGHKTYDILSFRPIPVGVSGGVSISGTLAGVVAALVFSLMLALLFPISGNQIMQVACVGIAGMLLDSVLGSKFQAKYHLHGAEIETATSGAQLVRGWSWLQNDLVNLLSCALLIALFLCYAFALS